MYHTIHISGWSDKIDLEERIKTKISNLVFGEVQKAPLCETTGVTIDNIFIRIYSSKEKMSLEQAMKQYLRKLYGDIRVIGTLLGYSEYTITNFNIKSMDFGGHNLKKIIDSYDNKYLHILIDQVENEQEQ